MKILFAFLIAALPSVSYSDIGNGYNVNFKNNEYKISLDLQCSPCDIACDKIAFKFEDLKDSVTKNLYGKSINTPHSMNFRGYIFKEGEFTYSLTEPNDAEESENNIWTFNIDERQADGGDKNISSQKINLVFSNGSC